MRQGAGRQVRDEPAALVAVSDEGALQGGVDIDLGGPLGKSQLGGCAVSGP